MTNKQRILKLLYDNQTITNADLAKELSTSEGYIKTEISKLKSNGYIFVEKENGVRKINVIRGIPVERSDYKKDIYQELLDGYMEDFREAETRNDRKEVGTLILRIIEKL
ncbi:winged helix-turn-helix domain-containing protein [Melissococcus plutonius]|uniref:winged helix-turn-helix domain-containing protein n=1 Tax=Melissococcus plutonius TaxID=33970 RepID=UPI0021E56D88|nr:winged helix-turn-helix domain-containing protein [Melissococcus plutonius]MCV2499587.1 winged helix-turn-helix domain-containing protein [Melissococcus plutonius]MCV2501733.1 winged helix-turn-helix domain-containing protein [Melissococcus plutonius]MCV2505957.1 winged helix-turn-helix domain-containing protein [Melissococcus plutonius]MCV2508199.1 winged helix-turn-helix domain-containing protein [Melissococcus plutonius]MCV2528025.1 winged helix-turn-helix domain-containing protein [Meli